MLPDLLTRPGERLKAWRKERGAKLLGEEAAIECRVAADFLIAFAQDAQDPLTNLKLQKMMYYAQAWHLAIHRRRLFDGVFEAWARGPVLPALYEQYRPYGWKPIDREDLHDLAYRNLRHQMDKDALDILDAVSEAYLAKTGYELELLVKSEEPWKTAREGKSPEEFGHEVIRDEWMLRYYSHSGI